MPKDLILGLISAMPCSNNLVSERRKAKTSSSQAITILPTIRLMFIILKTVRENQGICPKSEHGLMNLKRQVLLILSECLMRAKTTLPGGVTEPVHAKGMPAGDWTTFM